MIIDEEPEIGTSYMADHVPSGENDGCITLIENDVFLHPLSHRDTFERFD